MKSVVFFMAFAVSITAYAKEEVNEKDKTETHPIIHKDSKVGEVKVNSHFTGDGVMETTEIRFDVTCEKGYKLNPKFKKNNLFRTYDYGNNGKLTTWDAAKKIVTIHFRTAKILDNGEPAFDKAKTLEVDLSQACTR